MILKTEHNFLAKSLDYSIGIITHPSQTLQELKGDKRRLKYGLSTMLGVSILYGLIAIIGYFNGYEPQYPVPRMAVIGELFPNSYYFWMGLFTPVINLLGYIVLAGFMQFLGLLFKTDGNFEDCLALSCSTAIVQLPLFWLPEAVVLITPKNINILSPFPIINGIRQILAFIWMFWVALLAIRSIHELNWNKSIMISLGSYLPMLIIILTYVR